MGHYDNIKNVYFLGIGGIGMSALARYFRSQGISVSGYDRSDSQMVQTLRAEGIQVITSSKVADLPREIQEDKESLIVYTPAISKDHPQYVHFTADSYPLEKRAEVLGHLTRGHRTFAVAGTHGKTTTSTILAHLLAATGVELTAFLGGISENYGSNFIHRGKAVMVVEADEFDRSFLQLSPSLAAILSMDADHLDIYGDDAEIEKSFKAFAGLLPENGKLFVAHGLPLDGITVGVEDDASFSAQDITVEDGGYQFSLKTPERTYPGFYLALPGRHNLLNAVMALAMAIEYGVPANALVKALATFKGIRRRFSYAVKEQDLVLIDDYAHHPTEIAAVHQAVREMYPGKKTLAVFQPHLFSRTRDFADDFGKSLSLFDEVVLLDIYPARESPIEGVSAGWLLGKMDHPEVELVNKAELPEVVRSRGAQVVVVMGAGDISEEVEKIKKALTGEN